ncbi:hypothetical protein IVB30_05110 [Bradyrhizobium sp. 200]|uniref:hypothetical protein n=1 Tax=Bradyrhizobium sp. 200 TaxID=2782665 RepID=UPI001FFF3FEB|nr:hypothetical protein [Bradyrhizobium sp. 200]UPJ50783.1 hypothetical protein IVB30_05110 [Bradyrhizobium sp. 200]
MNRAQRRLDAARRRGDRMKKNPTVERHFESDRQWFRDNPTRAFRLRLRTALDSGTEAQNAVLVLSMAQGVYFHMPLTVYPEAVEWAYLHGAADDVSLSGLLMQAASSNIADMIGADPANFLSKVHARVAELATATTH